MKDEQMHEELLKVKADLAGLISARDAQIEKAIKDRATSKEDILNASLAMDRALASGDTKAYTKAKEKKQNAEDAVVVYDTLIENLNNAEAVSKEDGDIYLSRIHELQDARIEALYDAIKPLLLSLVHEAEEAFADIDAGNELISDYCREIRSFQKLLGYNGNEPIYVDSVPDFNAHESLRLFIEHIKNYHGYYERITGENVDYTTARKFNG